MLISEMVALRTDLFNRLTFSTRNENVAQRSNHKLTLLATVSCALCVLKFGAKNFKHNPLAHYCLTSAKLAPAAQMILLIS